MVEFDLQRFDGEEQPTNTESQPSPEQQEPIPEELGGLDEETAREAMAEWKQIQSESEQHANTEQQQPTANTAGDTVSRDEYQAKVNEAEHLKAQLADFQKRAQQPARQVQPPPMRITPEISAKITQAINAEAMNMTGFSPDDVASLDYADDNDPRLEQWQQAKTIAQSNVIGAIRQAQINQQQYAQQFLENQQSAINTYNDFARREFKEPDFKEVQNFATNELFNRLSPAEQKIIAESYFRIERQTASPAEMLVIKNYFEKAKAIYRGLRNRNNVNRQQPPVNLPRTDQLNGAGGRGEVTVAELERMLETTEFDKLPESYQRKLLGY